MRLSLRYCTVYASEQACVRSNIRMMCFCLCNLPWLAMGLYHDNVQHPLSIPLCFYSSHEVCLPKAHLSSLWHVRLAVLSVWWLPFEVGVFPQAVPCPAADSAQRQPNNRNQFDASMLYQCTLQTHTSRCCSLVRPFPWSFMQSHLVYPAEQMCSNRKSIDLKHTTCTRHLG